MKAVLYTYDERDALAGLRAHFSQLDWVVARSPEEVGREVGNAEILVLSNRVCTPELGDALRKGGGASLRWIHFVTSGIERGTAMGLPAKAIVSNAAGVRAPTVAEHAVTLLLALVRQLPALRSTQADHSWARVEMGPRLASLQGMTVCIVGLGSIGREIARKLKAFDAQLIGVSRTPANDGDIQPVFLRQRIGEAFGISDAVVIATTAEASSHRMIGTAEFAAIKPGAYFVNIARGEIVDEAALIAALRDERLAGAGLDVTEVEPLPPESPLWDMPNVIMTPHIAGAGAKDYEQQKALFGENLARFLARKPLLNLRRMPLEA
jgi:phosphoglycerate dehydrogenase-like enzyme